MNEFFATTADVYRLTGELDPAHDLHPSADNAAKDLAGDAPTPRPHDRPRRARRGGRRLARFAHTWRDRQVDELAGQLRRVIAAHGLSGRAVARQRRLR